MDYQIKLYAHGTPNGHCTWGVGDFDRYYINNFYGGRKSKVSIQMLVEVRQFDSSVYCYYTYLRTGNVCDNDGRSGGFFALTLRINYYYADIQNIYNVLDAAYNKYIVGTVVKVNDGAIKYLVTKFAQDKADERLKALEQELVRYLWQFSSKSDFVPLTGFKTNAQNGPEEVNVHECEMKDIAGRVKRNGSISVSPSYPSTKEQQLIQEKTNEINAVKAEAQRQIVAAQEKARNDVNEANRQKEADIEAVRKQYKNLNKTINTLQQENARLTQNAADNKKKHEDVIKDLEKMKVLYDNAYAILSNLAGMSAGPRANTQPVREESNGRDNHQGRGHSSLLKEFVPKTRPLVSFIILFVLFIIVCAILYLMVWLIQQL